jgi:energy-coupling factor transporter ATP-binding protein EcfA2
MAAVATFSDVRYQYPRAAHPALEGVSWELDEGAFALLIGKSGTGKSTLLRCLNGLVPHFTGGRFGGVVRVGTRDTRMTGPRDLANDVGFVFQDPETQMLTDRVDDELAFGLEQQGVPVTLMRKRVEELLDLLGIVHLRHRSPATLSGGERQRVAIAAALSTHPRLLVLDEPTSQLDPWGAEEVLTALRRFNEDLGLSIVLAEHRLERVLAHADIVRLLHDGGTVDGSPAEIAWMLDPVALPPVSALGRLLQWSDLPLTVKEARRHPLLGELRTRLEGRSPQQTASSMGRPVVEIQDAEVVLEGNPIARNTSLTVREGEFVALMGRNGSGKTTLLRSILGFQKLRNGRLVVNGRDVTGRDPADLGGFIGYVPQQPGALFFHERLIDELRYTARLRGQGDTELPMLLERLGLDFAAQRHPRDLSGGERQRAALAAILAGKPQVLVLDEPTRGMDPWHWQNLIAILKQVQAEGVAIMMATHDVELVAGSADRVVLLGDGSIVADGHQSTSCPAH